jgi:hypothetical protein
MLNGMMKGGQNKTYLPVDALLYPKVSPQKPSRKNKDAHDIVGLKGYGAAGKQVLKIMGGKEEDNNVSQNELQQKVDLMVNPKKAK